MIYAADFETTTEIDDCRVWAYGLAEIGNEENFIYGKDIDEMFDFLLQTKENHVLYFHNLKFDGEFIMYYLFHNGYIHVKDRKEFADKTFTTLISDMGMFYAIEICIKKGSGKAKKNHTIKIYDSLKILPFSVDKVAKSFNLPINKLTIDYTEKRAVGHELTEQEIEYLKHDVQIMAMALDIMFKQGLKKMTTGANALSQYKEIVTKKTFERMFPIPTYDEDIRQAYKGGFTYLKGGYSGRDFGKGIVLDVNSLYPSVMYERPMPYGEAIYFQGKYEYDEIYNLHIQHFSCQFELKKGYIPTIQIKHNLAFIPTEYLTSSAGEVVEFAMTNVDLELFFAHYDVWDITYYDGWKFKSSTTMFRDYIDKWNSVKVQATKDGNGGLRTIAKLMLNNLYGKFATNPHVRSKIPYLGEDDVIHFALGEDEHRDAIYIPVGCFVTAWARYKTITSAQKCYDRFIYADTDSLHLIGTEIPEGLDIDDTRLGAWKIESEFTRARFIHQKCYIEEIDGKLKITCAGMPESCYQYVTWENFHKGAQYLGKLRHTHAVGGVVLAETTHTIK